MHLTRLDYILWLASAVVMVAVLLAICKRRLYLSYPYFVAYVLLQILSYPLLFLLSKHSYLGYYYAYYAELFLSAALSLAVFWDIFKNVFRPSSGTRTLTRPVLRWGIVFVVIAIVGMNFFLHHPDGGTLARWALSSVSAARLAECALFLLLLLFRRYVGISRNHVIFGIALGFAFFAVVSMLASEVLQKFNGDRTWSLINSLAYFSTTVIWLMYMAFGTTQLDTPEGAVWRVSTPA